MIDHRMEKRVWDRIHGRPELLPREKIMQCLRREEANHRYYDSLRRHSLYGDAFGRLADDTMEHIKMLHRMMGE